MARNKLQSFFCPDRYEALSLRGSLHCPVAEFVALAWTKAINYNGARTERI